MSQLGKEIIHSLTQGLADIKAGKPMRQSIGRRVMVKGRPTWCIESFTAPVRRGKAKR